MQQRSPKPTQHLKSNIVKALLTLHCWYAVMYDLFERGAPSYSCNDYVVLATQMVGSWSTKFVNGERSSWKHLALSQKVFLLLDNFLCDTLQEHEFFLIPAQMMPPEWILKYEPCTASGICLLLYPPNCCNALISAVMHSYYRCTNDAD